MTDLEQTRADILGQFATRIDECENMLAEIHGGELPDAWIVRNARGNICLRYDMSRGRPENPRSCNPSLATRFPDRLSCLKVAHVTQNGAGEYADAVLLSVAVEEDMVEMRKLVAALQEAVEKDHA